MRKLFRAATTSCLLLLSTAAAPHAHAATIPDPRTSRTLVTAEELSETPRSNLYDFVRAKRPLWLRSRGMSGSGPTEVMVYVDGNRLGGAAQLREISPEIVSQMRYLDGREATMRWGSGHGGGAILIITGPAPAAARAVTPGMNAG